MFILNKAFAAAAALSLLAVPAIGADFKRIRAESEFHQTVAGKKLVAGWGWARVLSDGTIVGKAKGEPISGTWSWKNGYYCREVMIGSKLDPYDCLTVHVSGDNVVFIRDKGKGRQSPMKIR